ncbi:MAG: ATP synthase F1 subunit gamma [Candidatus Levyibacteriota bacterium]
MAENLQLLKRRIKTAKNVAQIAKAMEMMSASKIKRAQKTVESNKPYVKKIEEITSSLISQTNKNTFHHPYIDGNESNKKLVIAISPDKGLCGSLNTNIFKKLLTVDTKEVKLVTIGKKVERFAAKMSFDFVAAFPMGNTIPRYTNVYEMVKLIETFYNNGEVGSVDILFTEFHSFFQQTPVIKKLLPIDSTAFTENQGPFHLFEPNVPALLETLLPQYIEMSIYSALLEAYTSEQVARMIAMQNAKTNANDIASYLTLSYNKTRQEKITGEILDLTNSQQA